jgi:hypothetical protein
MVRVVSLLTAKIIPRGLTPEIVTCKAGLGFSRSNESAQDTTKLMVLYQLLDLISERIHSKVKLLLKRKDNSLLGSH